MPFLKSSFSPLPAADADLTIALAGNPNVGKSSIFNALTGMHQHTGNWPGKTVDLASGSCCHKGVRMRWVDLPGTYSLSADSPEEEAARDYLCFEQHDAVVVVCDATCLERNLHLLLQVLEITPRVVLCLNLMDEALKKGIRIDTNLLSQKLGIPVVRTSARTQMGLTELTEAVQAVSRSSSKKVLLPPVPPRVEPLVQTLEQAIAPLLPDGMRSRWAALQLLCRNEDFIRQLDSILETPLLENPTVAAAFSSVEQQLNQEQKTPALLLDELSAALVRRCEQLCDACVFVPTTSNFSSDRISNNSSSHRLDRLFLSRRTGIPVMLLLLFFVFWLTITGANYPSALLANALFWVQERLSDLFCLLHAPKWLHDCLVLGVWRVLAWVVSVMLPPMAIFFPLFTLLEDFGYLPRVAFNLDHCFQKAHTCGKQALTMCMGFGCNAAGVVGCRIIHSSRERLIAILTNSLVPCNGRFPTLIALISMFFVVGSGLGQSLLSALLLTLAILLSVAVTFFSSRLLSRTALRGESSSFVLELPPYRRPQAGRVIVRSIFDRTLFVLGRAIAVAAPAGFVIWLMANWQIDGQSLLTLCAQFLDPFARWFGIDGVILMAFILGFPANEIVFPLIVMSYLQSSVLVESESLTALHNLLCANGWSMWTAAAVALLCLFHWPCSTTCLTIYKETGSTKWTLLSILLPTVIGFSLCFLLNLLHTAIAL